MKVFLKLLASLLIILGGTLSSTTSVFAQDPPVYPLPTCTNPDECENPYWTQYADFYTTYTWSGCQPCSVRIAFAIRENCPGRGCEVKIGAVEIVNCPGSCSNYLQYGMFDEIIQNLVVANPNLCPEPNTPGECTEEFYVSSSTCYVYTTSHPQFPTTKVALPCGVQCCRRKYRICLDQDGVRHATLISRQRDGSDPALCVDPYNIPPKVCVDVCGWPE